MQWSEHDGSIEQPTAVHLKRVVDISERRRLVLRALQELPLHRPHEPGNGPRITTADLRAADQRVNEGAHGILDLPDRQISASRDVSEADVIHARVPPEKQRPGRLDKVEERDVVLETKGVKK